MVDSASGSDTIVYIWNAYAPTLRTPLLGPSLRPLSPLTLATGHALIACPHAALPPLRHEVYRSWADLVLSHLPPDFVPSIDVDLDPHALASSLSVLHSRDSSCVLLPVTIRDFLFSMEGPFRGSLPPRASAVSAITARSSSQLLVKGLSIAFDIPARPFFAPSAGTMLLVGPPLAPAPPTLLFLPCFRLLRRSLMLRYSPQIGALCRTTQGEPMLWVGVVPLLPWALMWPSAIGARGSVR